MVVLYIFLGILALIGLILMLPIQICLRYDVELGLRFRLKYAWIPLFDSTKQKTKSPKPETRPKKAASKKAKKPKKKSGAAATLLNFLGLEDIASIANAKRALSEKGLVQMVSDITVAVGALFTRIGQLIGHGVFTKFTLRVVVGDKDAADAAISYGRLCGVVYPLITMLDSAMTFRKRTVDLRCDFSQEETAVSYDGQLQYRPLHFLQFLWGLIKNYFKRSVT